LLGAVLLLAFFSWFVAWEFPLAFSLLLFALLIIFQVFQPEKIGFFALFLSFFMSSFLLQSYIVFHWRIDGMSYLHPF
ncbi:MAG: hypothetical protein ACKO7O_08370, partial [Bacteroidota bacterium]